MRLSTLYPQGTPFAFPELHDAIFSGFNQTDLTNFACTSKWNQAITREHLERVYDIAKALGRYMAVEDVTRFQAIQKYTGMIISGSFALRFMGQYSFMESDLDLYIPYWAATIIIQFLTCRGYTYTPRSTQDPDLYSALEHTDPALVVAHDALSESERRDWQPYSNHVGTFTFMRGETKVQVMTCRYNAICALFDFHSTVVMNAITHDAAISLYPYETFIRKRNLVIDPWEYGDDHTSRQEAAVMKYAARGWRMIKDVDIIEGLNSSREYGRLCRFVGDSMTRVIPLSPEMAPVQLYQPAFWNSWTLQYEVLVRFPSVPYPRAFSALIGWTNIAKADFLDDFPDAKSLTFATDAMIDLFGHILRNGLRHREEATDREILQRAANMSCMYLADVFATMPAYKSRFH